MNRVRDVALGLMVLAAVAFGATEAFAARGSVAARACGEWNWCAPSQGGQFNCDWCCGEFGGLCVSYLEEPYQGCICREG